MIQFMSAASRRVISRCCSCIDEMNMLRTMKRFWWLMLLVVGVPAAWGFALLGPVGNGGDSWQTPAIGYNPQRTIDALSTGPKNIGEEYRRNIGTIYYAYDASFLDFFGSSSNGVVPADQAFAIMNAVFSNSITGHIGVDGYSRSLEEFPLNSQHVNYEALALGLTDIKSLTLWALVEQMGLAWPERYVWDLHQAYLPTGRTPPAVCPDDEYYEVVQRNYTVDSSVVVPLQNNPYANAPYSPYVNDTLYTFRILYFPNCTPNPNYDFQFLAQTVPVDPFADAWTSVAGEGEQLLSGNANSFPGTFFTGLTRDDVAGLRYLMTSNNPNFETPAAGSVILTTNGGGYTTITTSNLNTLLLASQTNAPGLIPGLFPGVTVTSSTTNFGVLYTPITTTTVTTLYGTPYPGVPVISVVTNGYISTPMFLYQDTFGGIITNANLTNTPNFLLNGAKVVLSYSTNMSASLVTVSLGTLYGSPYPAPVVTNTTTQTRPLTNAASGEYFTIPTGQCGWSFKSPQPNGYPLTNVVATTNLIATVTNSSTVASNSVGFVGSVSLVTYFTNHTYVAAPIICGQATPSAGLYEGIEQLQFVRANFDSLLGQFFQPVTNLYTMTLITNSQTVVQHFQRVVTQPDILLSANDEPLTGALPFYTAFGRNVTFNQGNILPNLAGPGTITTPSTFTYNKAGNLYENGSMTSYGTTTNTSLPYLKELDQVTLGVIWATFDDSTNDPVVYPNGTSIQNLVNQMLIQVTPPAGILPDGTNGMAYTNIAFTATGGAFTAPYTWGLAPGSQPLPQGLSLTSANSAGTLSGKPQNNPLGTFDFAIQLTDSIGRSVSWNYQIKIH
jgi:hypothetical protein